MKRKARTVNIYMANEEKEYVKNEHVIGNLIMNECKLTINENGTNNFIVCDNTNGDVIFEKSDIKMNGSNCVIFLEGGSRQPLRVNITVYNDSVVYIGKNTFFHRKGKKATVKFIAGESGNIIIGGQDVMLAKDVLFRTSDAHPVYSTATHKRINQPKDIIIGDHVWLGEGSVIFKGAVIGSGSILGTGGFTSNKWLPSNSAFGGIPAKMISEEGAVFFTTVSANVMTDKQREALESFEGDDWIYTYDPKACVIKDLLTFLANERDVQKKIEYFKNFSKNKNRFALSSEGIASLKAK